MSQRSVINLLLDGKVVTSPTLVNTRVFEVQVEVKRTSGVVDTVLVNYPDTLRKSLNIGDFIHIEGDIRTLNKLNSSQVIKGFVYASDITILDKEPEHYINRVDIKGAELSNIEDLRIVNINGDERNVISYEISLYRAHGRYSYFDVTTWDRDAVAISNMRNSGTRLDLSCSLQSRIGGVNNRLYLKLVSFRVNFNQEKGVD